MVATVVGPIIGAAAGIAIDRAIAKRPKLQTHWGHVSAHRIPMPDGNPPIIVNTHSVIVRNAGKATANKVRVTHSSLAGINFQVFPTTAYTVENLPDGGAQIVFPELVPDAEVSIQYVGIGVRTDNIMGGCYSSEGQAILVNMRPTRVFSKGVERASGVLLLLGAAVALYGVARGLLWLWPRIAAAFPG